MSNQNKLFAWQDSKGGLVFIVLFDLLMTYGFASLAINSGSLLQYVIALLFLVLAIAQAAKLFRKLVRHDQ